ncbi:MULTISPECIES: thioredoxin TrxA [unclassified Romboutsia]|uniref:thioredoxin TrxA n=1 Tax=unclassified Romboutsia TaxID=2626894 RepID=UPI00082228F5|nr:MULTISPECIES: thioredoxin domain-containing protein [unclassified Romboutsia]SCH39621.1 Thioredoxin [uncultured Clostridium sp.]
MITVDKNNFEQEVLNYDGIVVVEFWSQVCEPCKELLPFLEELDLKYGKIIKFCELDTKKSIRVAIKEKVLGLPAIVIYKKGKRVDEVVKDNATEENIENMVKKYI